MARSWSGVDTRLHNAAEYAKQQTGEDYSVRQGTRTAAEARANAKKGVGVANSLHVPDARGVGHGVDIYTPNGGVVSRKFAAAMQEYGQQNGYTVRWGNVAGFLPNGRADPGHFDLGPGSRLTGVAYGLDAGHPVPPANIPNPGTPKAGGQVEAYIRQAATARGIDPDVAVRVAKSEGGLDDPLRQSDVGKKEGHRETSYGPFQLRINGGLGDEALKAGVDPRKDWQGGVDFALNYAAKNGWGSWYGAVNPGPKSGFAPISRTAGLEGAQPVAIGTLAYTGGPPQTAAQQAAAGLAAAGTLRKGATDARTGGAVTRLQRQLAAVPGGPPVAVDGKYGPQTAAAVRAVEKQYRLTPDRGVAGPQVQAALAGNERLRTVTDTRQRFGDPLQPGGFPLVGYPNVGQIPVVPGSPPAVKGDLAARPYDSGSLYPGRTQAAVITAPPDPNAPPLVPPPQAVAAPHSLGPYITGAPGRTGIPVRDVAGGPPQLSMPEGDAPLGWDAPKPIGSWTHPPMQDITASGIPGGPMDPRMPAITADRARASGLSDLNAVTSFGRLADAAIGGPPTTAAAPRAASPPPVGRFGTTDYFPADMASSDYTTGVPGRTGNAPGGINNLGDIVDAWRRAASDVTGGPPPSSASPAVNYPVPPPSAVVPPAVSAHPSWHGTKLSQSTEDQRARDAAGDLLSPAALVPDALKSKYPTGLPGGVYPDYGPDGKPTGMVRVPNSSSRGLPGDEPPVSLPFSGVTTGARIGVPQQQGSLGGYPQVAGLTGSPGTLGRSAPEPSRPYEDFVVPSAG